MCYFFDRHFLLILLLSTHHIISCCLFETPWKKHSVGPNQRNLKTREGLLHSFKSKMTTINTHDKTVRKVLQGLDNDNRRIQAKVAYMSFILLKYDWKPEQLIAIVDTSMTHIENMMQRSRILIGRFLLLYYVLETLMLERILLIFFYDIFFLSNDNFIDYQLYEKTKVLNSWIRSPFAHLCLYGLNDKTHSATLYNGLAYIFDSLYVWDGRIKWDRLNYVQLKDTANFYLIEHTRQFMFKIEDLIINLKNQENSVRESQYIDMVEKLKASRIFSFSDAMLKDPMEKKIYARRLFS